MRRQLVDDHAIAAVAERQGGVIARAQLTGLGLSGSAIDRRLRGGRLHGLYRGVYAVGHRSIGPDGRRWAAVPACGPGAVLSHVSAGAAWGLVRRASATLHVTVGPGGRGRQRGLRVHRSTRLPPSEVTRVAGVPITTPSRTLLDLAAGGLRGRQLEQALDRAERVLRVDWAAVDELLVRHAGKRRDFFWPGTRLVVEADSYAWHRSPSALNEDRERDVRLTLAGFVPLRFTYDQCTRRPRYVRNSILRALLDELASPCDVKSSSARGSVRRW